MVQSAKRQKSQEKLRSIDVFLIERAFPSVG